ncbi:Hypothetical predicted protein, partial [Pelobates cultripes]
EQLGTSPAHNTTHLTPLGHRKTHNGAIITNADGGTLNRTRTHNTNLEYTTMATERDSGDQAVIQR